jgi:hypothetical protein
LRNGIISSNIYVVLNRNFHSNVNVLGRFYKQFLTSLYRSTLFGIFLKPDSKQKYLQVEHRIYVRNLFVHRSFLQYKSQCLEKVNVKYVIKRLWHEIFHMVLGINPRPISALQLRCRAWYGSLGLIPGPIWKISCNNLLLLVTYACLWKHNHIVEAMDALDHQMFTCSIL